MCDICKRGVLVKTCIIGLLISLVRYYVTGTYLYDRT